MFRKAFSFGGLLLLAGATALVTPSLSQARGGGGHGGGGGFHGGGHFGGGFHGGSGQFGGYRGGFYHGGSYGHPYAHYGYRHYYGGYGFYPSYGGYGAYPSSYYGSSYSYDPYSRALPEVTDESGYDGPYGAVTPSYSYGSSSYYAPATDTSARVTVKVPAGAQVWFGGTPTTSAGPVREYQSPPLTSGRQYTYEVQARWNEDGREVTQTQQVEVTAGAHADVSFPAPSNAAGLAR
jgi:uncharacterized protein (TIGR03000 family)